MLIAGAALVILIGVGAYLKFGNKVPASPLQKTEQTAKTTMGESFPDMYTKAMSGNGSLKCTFSGETVTGTSYIKGGMVRLDSTSPTTNKQSHTILKNKVIWSWNDGEATGFTMDTTAIQAQITGTVQQMSKPEDIQKQIEANKPACAQVEVADSLFVAPTTVKFTDYTKMMEDLKSRIPANVTIPAGYKMPGQ